ncbi:MAG: hypothetical protein U1D31_02960 [Patescibacteria group bacterium]|nr:hypothetical protein [bacterium]MDZ4241053.1 hypothetical protein [Patescibacteria group bacterium]
MLKKFLIPVIIFVIIAGALGAYFFFLQNKNPNNTFFGDLFPFGQGPDLGNGSTVTESGGENGNGNEEANILPAPQIRKITGEQVAGVTLIDAASTTVIRYIERGTGHIYEADALTLALKKISNTTIPKIYEALWTGKGDSVILRYLKDDNETIETFYAKLSKNSISGADGNSVSDLEGSFLQTDIREIAVSPDKNSIFSLVASVTSGSGVISRPDGTQKQTFPLPLKEWVVSWPTQDTVLLTTKPSAEVGGYVYTFNTSTGELGKITGEVGGITASADQSLNYLLYSESKQKSFFLNLLNIADKTITRSPSQTLPEKCVWSKKEKSVIYCAVPKTIPSNDYPDAWYQGIVSFSDKILKIDFENNTTSVIADTKEAVGEEVDAVSLSLNAEENYLVFLNKKDSSLWGIQITP